MNAFIFLLAGLCTVYASGGGQIPPCMKQCKDAMYGKLAADPELSKLKPDLASPEGRKKLRECIRNYISGTGSPPPMFGNKETWAKLCPIATEAETCIDACADVPAEKKAFFKKMLTLFKLGCSEDFKSSVSCLMDAYKQPSPACQTKCLPLAEKLKDFLAQRETNPTDTTPASKEVLESGCKFFNCRFNCRKADIVSKCQEKGFEQSKKLASAVAICAKGAYKRGGGDLSKWPQICESDKVIEPIAAF